MFGLAVLAAGLATERRERFGDGCLIVWGDPITGPCTRGMAERLPEAFPASAEYYRICDRIARGWKP